MPYTGLVLEWLINALASGKFEWNFRYVIFKRILVIDGWGIFCEIALIWMSLDFTDDQLKLIQVMAWCRQYHCRRWADSLHSPVDSCHRIDYVK